MNPSAMDQDQRLTQAKQEARQRFLDDVAAKQAPRKFSGETITWFSTLDTPEDRFLRDVETIVMGRAA